MGYASPMAATVARMNPQMQPQMQLSDGPPPSGDFRMPDQDMPMRSRQAMGYAYGRGGDNRPQGMGSRFWQLAQRYGPQSGVAGAAMDQMGDYMDPGASMQRERTQAARGAMYNRMGGGRSSPAMDDGMDSGGYGGGMGMRGGGRMGGAMGRMGRMGQAYMNNRGGGQGGGRGLKSMLMAAFGGG